MPGMPSCQAAQRELDALAAVPRRVELLAGLVLDAHVVDGHGVAGLGLGALAHDDVADDQVGRRRSGGCVDLGLGAVVSHDTIQPSRDLQRRISSPSGEPPTVLLTLARAPGILVADQLSAR
jgi:hypothetical protein